MMKIKCWFLGHDFVSKTHKFRNQKEYYKNICDRCGKGKKNKWKVNTRIIILR